MIEKVRIRNIDSYLIGIHDNDNFFIAKKASEINVDKLNLLGFTSRFRGYFSAKC